MSTKKQIQKNEWQQRLQTFISGNRGRTSAIAAEGMTLVESKPLLSVDYDPAGKGNDLMISLEGFSHTVSAPAELFITEASNGVVSTMEVVDQNGKSTILRLI